MTINGTDIDISGVTPLVDFLTGGEASGSQIDSGSFEQNINGDGKLSLSWRSSEGGGINAGTVVTVDPGGKALKYYMQDNYTPTPNGDGTYTWSPSFVSVDERLKGILVYKRITVYRNDTVNNNAATKTTKDINIYTFPYYGQLETLLDLLRGCEGVPEGALRIGEGIQDHSVNVNVSFDQDNLVSAAQKIASALGTTTTIVDGVITIGPSTALAVSEHYDRFVVFGGTRNMGKHIVEGDDTYAAVTFRLTLDEEAFPDSVMPANQPAEGHMSKILIFDDIYPEMKLAISGVRKRVCYLFDESGNKIVTVADGREVEKTYTKYYITLNLNDESYRLNVKSVIQGRTLGIVFQTGLLAGREFDLAYYEQDDGSEYNSTEDTASSWTALAGEYRICIVADGDTLLPNETLEPKAGDVVTLTGVALDGSYEREAKERLRDAALPLVNLYMNPRETDVTVSSNEEEVITDFMTGETQSVSPGESHSDPSGAGGDYVVTSVTTDLLTGKQTIRYGTFEPEGKVSSMANQLETATAGASGATVGQGSEDYIRHTAAMSLDQFETLYKVYGRLGMKTVNSRVDATNETVNALRESMNYVVEQADKKFDIWFTEGKPQPYYDEDEEEIAGTANFPASEWATDEEKEAHLQDICYDKTRAADGTGGMAWRWEKLGNAYCWKLVSDQDTIAALTQLADLSRDNILTPSEKLALRREWDNMKDELVDLVGQSEANGISATEYICAYYSLWMYLSDAGGQATADSHRYIENAYRKLTVSPVSVADAITQLDAYLAGHDTDTQISGIVASLRTGTASSIGEATEGLKEYMMRDSVPAMISSAGNGSIDSAAYNALLTAYKTERTALMTALSEKSLAKLDDMASDDVLTDIEKLSVVREYERMVKETVELIARATAAGLDNDSGSVQYQYRDAYSALYAYLDDLTTAAYTVFSGDLSGESSPGMLYNGADTVIAGATFTGLWAAYYEKAAALRQAIQSKGVKVFVTNSQSQPQNPVPPYKAGDLWIHTDQSGNSVIKICINDSDSSQFDAADWSENTIYTDPRSVLAALAEEVFNAVGSSTSGSVTVNLGATPSPTISGNVSNVDSLLAVLHAMLGDITFTIAWGDEAPSETPNTYSLHCQRVKFRTYTGGIKVSMYNENGAWEVIQHSTSALIDNLGNMINLVVFGSAQGSLQGSLDSYVEGSGITTAQNFVKMFAEAQMWDGNSMASISEAMFGMSVEVYRYKEKNGSSTITKQTYDNLPESQQANYIPVYTSSARMSADYINFKTGTFKIQTTVGGADKDVFTVFDTGRIEACVNYFSLKDINGNSIFTVDINNNVKLGADKIDFSGTEIDLTGATSINLNAPVINLNADKINWLPETPTQQGEHTYMDVIPGGSGSGYTPLTQSKFLVDDEGNVTMNNATMNSATVYGTIYANAGKIGGTNGWTIATNQISEGTLGDDGSMFLSTTDIDGTGLSSSHPLHHANLRFTVGSKFGVLSDGTLVASNANISGNLTIPSTGGSVSYSNANGNFGFFLSSMTAFESRRSDYLSGGTTRGALLHIKTLAVSNTYRGIFCDAEVEMQGKTQLLRAYSDRDNQAVNALIVEGIDNKSHETIALSLRLKGGLMQMGQRLYGPGGTIDLSAGTTVLIKCTNNDSDFFLPSLSAIRSQLGCESTDTFCLPVTIVGAKGTLTYNVKTGDGCSEYFIGWDGDNRYVLIEMSEGDSLELMLVYDGTTYYAQLVTLNH